MCIVLCLDDFYKRYKDGFKLLPIKEGKTLELAYTPMYNKDEFYDAREATELCMAAHFGQLDHFATFSNFYKNLIISFKNLYYYILLVQDIMYQQKELPLK